ncbi:hypothetical protein [Komagataeibacter xylinus]|uniref:hypothetical protein n=1 Tax=Komagataeibacter xylinus TaxID=28448 RepID=UPI00197FC7C5|nr:hypothetical protein [Komagataeibacter xylinus]
MANASTLLAHNIVPLAYAPYVTMLMGLLFQLGAPFLLLTAKDAWLASPRIRLVAVALLLFVPESIEVSAHSMHIQFHLALCCGLILALATTLGWQEYMRLGLLFLGPLSGPGAVSLAPLFIVRLFFDRTRARLIECLVIIGASATQVLLFFGHYGQRTYNSTLPDFILAFFVRYILYPFFGFKHLVATIGYALQKQEAAGHMPYGVIALTLVLMALFAGTILYQAVYNKNTRDAAWLALAGGWHACASMYGALGGASTMIFPHFSERYVFVGQSMLACSILCLAVTGRRMVSRICWGLVVLMLVFGFCNFWSPFVIPRMLQHGSAWRGEVARWEKDHSYGLHVWPDPQWVMYLDGSHTAEQRMQACPVHQDQAE